LRSLCEALTGMSRNTQSPAPPRLFCYWSTKSRADKARERSFQLRSAGLRAGPGLAREEPARQFPRAAVVVLFTRSHEPTSANRASRSPTMPARRPSPPESDRSRRNPPNSQRVLGAANYHWRFEPWEGWPSNQLVGG